MKDMTKTEVALCKTGVSLKENRNQLQNQLSDLESDFVYCYLPGMMKDRLIISLEEAIDVLDQEIAILEDHITFQELNQGLGLQK